MHRSWFATFGLTFDDENELNDDELDDESNNLDKQQPLLETIVDQLHQTIDKDEECDRFLACNLPTQYNDSTKSHHYRTSSGDSTDYLLGRHWFRKEPIDIVDNENQRLDQQEVNQSAANQLNHASTGDLSPLVKKRQRFSKSKTQSDEPQLMNIDDGSIQMKNLARTTSNSLEHEPSDQEFFQSTKIEDSGTDLFASTNTVAPFSNPKQACPLSINLMHNRIFQRKFSQKVIKDSCISLPTLNHPFAHQKIKRISARTSIGKAKKPFVSILKSSQPGNNAPHHRPSCPQGSHHSSKHCLSDFQQSGKMSGDAGLGEGDSSDGQRHGNGDQDKQSFDGGRLRQLENQAISCEKPQQRPKELLLWESFADVAEDSMPKDSCTCQASKSVHILTPTINESVILFDPQQSAANNFFPVTTVVDHETTTGQANYLNSSFQKFLDGRMVEKQQVKQAESHGIETNEQSKQRTEFCECNPEQMKLISYHVCYNCQKPVDIVAFSTLPSPSPSIFHQPSSSSSSAVIEAIHDAELAAVITNVINKQQQQKRRSCEDCDSNLITPLVTDSEATNNNNNSSYFTACQKNNFPMNTFNTTRTFPGDRFDFNENCCDIELEPYFLEDQPRYCKKCNLWFGSLDPSYPYKCDCLMPKSNTLTTTNETGSIYSIHMRKDFRYYLQHPYSRLFVAYFVAICNFLIFAEDPLNHSLMECSIPILGNVISFLFTKYPVQSEWQLVKALLSVSSISFGLLFGKYLFHHIILRKIFRLKMFRDESGTWMIMLLSTFLFCYLSSLIYNMLLLGLHPTPELYLITSRMGISYSSFMKIAACGTWLGDFFTAWMITDMMLQDNLYPDWAKFLRRIWHQHANFRIVVFWMGCIIIASIGIHTILSEMVCWDCINQGYISTTELSRAFLASAILFMDLLIVMQDWDFPHFVSDLNIKLPGLLHSSYTFNFCRKSLKFPPVEIRITGKWFNYGIIVFVMMLDLNMWKNQIIYFPADYGQYINQKTGKVFTINDPESLNNETLNWTFEKRNKMINSKTNRTFIQDDLSTHSRYLGYASANKALSFIPIAMGFMCFLFLVYHYGRFPPKTDASIGGRFRKRRTYQQKSSWRRERRDSRSGHLSQWPHYHQNLQVNDDYEQKISTLNHYPNNDEMMTATSETSTSNLPEPSTASTISHETMLPNNFFKNLSGPTLSTQPFNDHANPDDNDGQSPSTTTRPSHDSRILLDRTTFSPVSVQKSSNLIRGIFSMCQKNIESVESFGMTPISPKRIGECYIVPAFSIGHHSTLPPLPPTSSYSSQSRNQVNEATAINDQTVPFRISTKLIYLSKNFNKTEQTVLPSSFQNS